MDSTTNTAAVKFMTAFRGLLNIVNKTYAQQDVTLVNEIAVQSFENKYKMFDFANTSLEFNGITIAQIMHGYRASSLIATKKVDKIKSAWIKDTNECWRSSLLIALISVDSKYFDDAELYKFFIFSGIKHPRWFKNDCIEIFEKYRGCTLMHFYSLYDHKLNCIPGEILNIIMQLYKNLFVSPFTIRAPSERDMQLQSRKGHWRQFTIPDSEAIFHFSSTNSVYDSFHFSINSYYDGKDFIYKNQRSACIEIEEEYDWHNFKIYGYNDIKTRRNEPQGYGSVASTTTQYLADDPKDITIKVPVKIKEALIKNKKKFAVIFELLNVDLTVTK